MPDKPGGAPKWKRRIRKVLLGVFCAPPLLLAAGNLALATPWAKARLIREVEARTGLEAKIGSLTWTPWGGACLGNLQLLQPPALREVVREPLLEVREVQVHPRWKPLFKGDLQLAKLRLDRPRAAISLEMLANLATQGSPPPTTGPEVAAKDTLQPAPAMPLPAPTAADQLPTEKRMRALPDADTGAEPAPASDRGTTWIEIADAELDFFLGPTNIVKCGGLDGKIPLGGDPAEGRCSAKTIVAIGQTLAQELDLPLAWKGPELHIGPGEIVVAGTRIRVEAALGRLPGVPFAAELVIAEQAVDAGVVFQTRKPRASRVVARVQGAGLLAAPGSWKGAATAAAQEFSIQAGGSELVFGEASFTGVLDSGTLHCPEVRLVGEPISLLGNGTIRTNGEGSAVLRAVMPPEVAASWRARLVKMAVAIPPVFSEMESPDRLFIDLRWVSYPGGQGIEFGSGGPVVPIADAAKVLGGVI